MRQFLSISLSTLSLLVVLHQSVAYAFFSWEKEKIIAERCEQKDAAENTCQGSCYLREVLNIQEESETSEPAFVFEYEPILYHPSLAPELPQPLVLELEYPLPILSEYQNLTLLGIWRPPRLSA